MLKKIFFILFFLYSVHCNYCDLVFISTSEEECSNNYDKEVILNCNQCNNAIFDLYNISIYSTCDTSHTILLFENNDCTGFSSKITQNCASYNGLYFRTDTEIYNNNYDCEYLNGFKLEKKKYYNSDNCDLNRSYFSLQDCYTCVNEDNFSSFYSCLNEKIYFYQNENCQGNMTFISDFNKCLTSELFDKFDYNQSYYYNKINQNIILSSLDIETSSFSDTPHSNNKKISTSKMETKMNINTKPEVNPEDSFKNVKSAAVSSEKKQYTLEIVVSLVSYIALIIVIIAISRIAF